jgi:hypothetical protein
MTIGIEPWYSAAAGPLVRQWCDPSFQITQTMPALGVKYVHEPLFAVRRVSAHGFGRFGGQVRQPFMETLEIPCPVPAPEQPEAGTVRVSEFLGKDFNISGTRFVVVVRKGATDIRGIAAAVGPRVCCDMRNGLTSLSTRWLDFAFTGARLYRLEVPTYGRRPPF